MKWLLTGVVVTVLLGICSPSYGDYFLIYNTSVSVKGGNAATDKAVNIPLKGILVFHYGSGGLIEDVNLITYGEDFNKPRRQNVYVEHDFSDMVAGQHAVDVNDVNGGYLLMDITEHDSPFYFEGVMLGKWKYMTIDSQRRKVAGNLTGSFDVWGGCLLGPDISYENITGIGIVSATLNTKQTNWANGSDFVVKTQDEVITWAKRYLGSKGYVESALP